MKSITLQRIQGVDGRNYYIEKIVTEDEEIKKKPIIYKLTSYKEGSKSEKEHVNTREYIDIVKMINQIFKKKGIKEVY